MAKNSNQKLAERILTVRGKASMKAFANEVGVSDASISKYENGQAVPSVDVAARIARFGNVSLEWLIGASDDPGGMGDAIELPRVEQAASAGTGLAVLEEVPGSYLRISQALLAGVNRNGADLAVLDVVGDSMVPTLLDGDVVVVDRSIRSGRHVSGGGIFVFTVGTELFVKRLAIAGRQLVALSDNEAYDTMTFDLDVERDDVIIHGRVERVFGPPRVIGNRK